MKDMIEMLQEQDPEAIVYVYADHGQTPEQCNYVTEGYVESAEYFLDGIPPSEEELEDNYSDNEIPEDIVKVVVIY